MERVMVDNGELWLIIWLVVWNMAFMILLTFHILGMSSFQLTNIFQRGWNHQPVFIDNLYHEKWQKYIYCIFPGKRAWCCRCCHHRKCWSLVVEKHVSIIIHIASHHMIPRILRTDPVVCPDCNMRKLQKIPRVRSVFCFRIQSFQGFRV